MIVDTYDKQADDINIELDLHIHAIDKYDKSLTPLSQVTNFCVSQFGTHVHTKDALYCH